MTNRNLHDLLIPLGINAPYKELREMKLDSRKVLSGDLFLAIEGYQIDGRQYISDALIKGASAIISDVQKEKESGTIQYLHNNVPIVYIKNLKHQLSYLAGLFYQHPATQLRLIGVTGTNGKTTITQLIAQWAQAMGEVSGVIGTLGNGMLEQLIHSENTTDSAVDIQYQLRLLLDNRATLVAMEISSHSLIQSRVYSIPFDAVVFTNLGYDHLDYHGNLENYIASKWLLFSTHKSDKQIINVDDNIGLQWLNRLPNSCAVSIKNRIPNNWKGYWISVDKVNYHDYKTTISFNSIWGTGILKSPLIGSFNVSNIMLAMATLLMMGYPLNLVIKSSYYLKPICGRMEIFTSFGQPTVIVDYAHNPNALKKALIALRFHCRSKLWCVFGCGGDRDKTKRSLMGRIAEQYADVVILTDDNPRSEKSKVIMHDILSGFINSDRTILIASRMEAITNAILHANADDIILISGKGHERYQIIGNNKLNYSDQLTVAKLLGIIK
ncbi:UDP-N-acetylmuramoyl-L-alanyl-D-glutamate--2,6-diaminopimelate ligase [Arsenophonus endosymbiont of Lipoptena cervi]|uniref:UDP-N-acetylmuramoyl-L-alanyl-D-glutamate--2, 6-diaminopimelate ligase n=1 Tax=Arsenophonus endosymbiont of Lipoptena cervi TaxID=363258 RepID=UPI00376F1689